MGDFTVTQLVMQTLPQEGTGKANQDFIRFAYKHNAVNFSNQVYGTKFTRPDSVNVLRERPVDSRSIHATFSSAEDLAGFLKDLHEANNGVSVVVSGLLDEVKRCCNQAGLKPHTVNLSLGIHGKKDNLAPDNLRPIMTMCGHGYVPAALVLDYVDKIKKKKITAAAAGEKLAELCPCGVFNPIRAADLMMKLANSD